MKKLLVLFAVLAMIFCFTATSMADPPGQNKDGPGYYQHTVTGAVKYFSNGHPGNPSQWIFVGDNPEPQCNDCDLVAVASPSSWFGNTAFIEHPSEMGGGMAFGDVTLSAEAVATGKDVKFLGHTIINGYALALAETVLEGKVYVLVKTTGEVGPDGGLSATKVKAIGVLDFSAEALATGGFKGIFRNGCPQYTMAELEGVFGVLATGYSLSIGPNGSYAFANGMGETTVEVHAFSDDFDNRPFLGITWADTSIEGKIIVKQGYCSLSYVSPDGTTAINFAKVTGGSAIALGDAEILGIRSSGTVSQEGAAVGAGGIASGSSYAHFSNAEGYVLGSRCVDFAQGNGMAVVAGYNNVTVTPNSVKITSQQSAFATTGGHHMGGQPN